MIFLEEVDRIFLTDTKDWLIDSAEIDYFMPMPEDYNKIIKLFNLIKENLGEALKCKNKYIMAFAKMVQNEPDMFMRGDEAFQKNYPGI